MLAAIIERERPDAVLPTLGGQTALNLAMELSESGILDEFGVPLIGANAEAIRTAEDRDLFKAAMGEIGLEVPASGFAATLDEAVAVGESDRVPDHDPPELHPGRVGHRDRLRPRRAGRRLGKRSRGEPGPPGSRRALDRRVEGVRARGDARPGGQLRRRLLDRELRSRWGSTPATRSPSPPRRPSPTSSTRRCATTPSSASAASASRPEGRTSSSPSNPEDGKRLVIEMNPRVSRSSALASKATGFPIAKIAARLAVGYTLDEITNDITGATPASFEPAIDYVVTKIPRWAFEKLPGAPDELGHADAVGRRGDGDRPDLPGVAAKSDPVPRAGPGGSERRSGERKTELFDDEQLLERTAQPTPERFSSSRRRCGAGIPVDLLADRTGVDRWFLDQLGSSSSSGSPRAAGGHGPRTGAARCSTGSTARRWRDLKRLGFSDAQLAFLLSDDPEKIDQKSHRVRGPRGSSRQGVRATFKTVDTCAAEFEAHTPYHYATYEDEDEVRPSSRPRVVILGSGPNRIGQGIEFDYCCVHASHGAARASGTRQSW